MLRALLLAAPMFAGDSAYGESIDMAEGDAKLPFDGSCGGVAGGAGLGGACRAPAEARRLPPSLS